MESMFDIETLLTKYAGGQMPSLVDMENPASGLINGELLEIYHSGVSSKHSIPFAILLAAKGSTSLGEKWWNGDFRLNEWSRPHWTAFCRALRGKDVGNESCEKCDRRWAIMAEREGGVVAYLCDNGLIDFATPISVKGQVLAVLFCGQFKPEEGAIWNPEFIQRDGFFRPLEPGEHGVDAWDESLRRMRGFEQRVGLSEGALQKRLSDSYHSAKEISPQKVQETKALLTRAAAQLSDLAKSTYELEKGRVIGWIRDRITRSLLPLSTTPVDTSGVWRQLSLGLEHIVGYFELDYALILSCCDKAGKGIKVLSQSGLPERNFPMGKSIAATDASLSKLRSGVCQLEEPSPLVVRDHKDLPFLHDLSRMHKRSKQAMAVRIPVALGTAAPIMILGRFKRGTELSALYPDDRKDWDRIVESITMVTELVLLVEQLEGTTRKQALFLEDVAHNIRTPIQNIVIEAEVLTRGLAPPQGVPRRVERIAAQVRRLHRMSQRAWTLVNIDRGTFKRDSAERVSVYEVLMEQRKSLHDLAERRGIEILVDPEEERRDRGERRRDRIEQWPLIRVSRQLFSQAVLNLMDNAVKYSRDNTEVRIYGRRSPGGVTLSFTNRGIRITEEEKGRIFERYYRTKEAKMHVQTGTGIGLAIVEAFVELYGGNIEVKSVPIHGTRDYLTEFRVFIPERGW